LAIVLPNGRNYFATSTGAPLVGGKVYAYVAGTSTPKDTYTTSAGTVANTHPIVLDSRGEAAIYWDGTYDVVLKTSADVTVWGPERLADAAGNLQDDLADSSSASLGDALVAVKRTATGAVATTQHAWHEGQALNVFDFLSAAQIADVIARTNTVDVTTPVLAAIAAAGDTKKLIWPAGSYKITATLTCATNRTHWEGAGRVATQIYFAPIAADTCLELGVGGATKVLGKISGFGFYSDDSTYKKIAIDCIDLSNWVLSDISINGGVVASAVVFWSGASSVGIRVRGKDLTGLRDIFIAADLPIQVSVNPNLASITIDHWNFHNCYLIANANPIVTIDTNVYLTQVSFTGYQSWVLGTAGIKWADTTSTGVSNGLVLENVRTEQATDATAYLVDISHNTGLQNLVLRNCYSGLDRRTAKLRKVETVTFDNYFHAGTAITIDADATVKRMELRNCFWQAGSTAVLAGQRLVWGSPLNPNTAPLPSSALYDESANADRNENHEGMISATSVSVANDGVTGIGATGTTGMVLVATSEGVSALYALNGTNNTVNEVSDPSGVFTVTANNAATNNIYWSAGNSRYELQNKRGVTVRYVVVPLGSYTGI
jgi:hypothetical protein